MSGLPHMPSHPSVSDSLPDVRREGKYEDSGPEAGTPNNSIESTDWGNISTWPPGAISPSFQEVLGGTGVFHAAPTAYSAYPDLLLAAYESVSQTTSRPALPHLLGQMVNTGPDSYLFDLLEEMEGQNRSPRPRPSSAFGPYHSGPGHAAPLIIDRHDHVSFGLPLSNPLESVSHYRQIKSTPDLELRSANGVLIVIPGLYPDSVSDNWRRIPQTTYTQRKGDRSFLQPQEISFSVNNIRGFNIGDALGKLFTGLDGRDEPVLEDANGPAVSCRLLFPGYPINIGRNPIAVRNWKKSPTPIIRSKLAHEIARRVKQYMDELATVPIDPSVDPRWTIGQGRMKVEKMYLVSVAWVSKGSLQPEIWVDDS